MSPELLSAHHDAHGLLIWTDRMCKPDFGYEQRSIQNSYGFTGNEWLLLPFDKGVSL